MPHEGVRQDVGGSYRPLASVGFEQVDDALVVRLGGEIDLSNARAMGDDIREAARRHRLLVVDLAGLAFLDAAGLAMLTRLAAAWTLRGGSFAVAVPPGSRIAAVLRLSGVDAEIRVAATVEEALRGSATA